MFENLKRNIERKRERRFYEKLIRMYYKYIQRISYESISIASDKALTEEEKNIKLSSNALRMMEIFKCIEKCRAFLKGLE